MYFLWLDLISIKNTIFQRDSLRGLWTEVEKPSHIDCTPTDSHSYPPTHTHTPTCTHTARTHTNTPQARRPARCCNHISFAPPRYRPTSICLGTRSEEAYFDKLCLHHAKYSPNREGAVLWPSWQVYRELTERVIIVIVNGLSISPKKGVFFENSLEKKFC